MARRKSADESTTDVILEPTDLAQRLASKSGNGPTTRTIERWRNNGEGPPFIKIGHRVGYRQSAVEQWLDEQTRTHTNDTGATRRRKAR